MKPVPAIYASYLIRFWQEYAEDDAARAIWRAEVEHIQTGACHRFLTLEALWQYLRQHTSGSNYEDPLSEPQQS